MPENISTYYHSPLGILKITGTPSYITEVLFQAENINEPAEGGPAVPQTLLQCVKELTEYFDGTRTNFEVPFFQQGTAFQTRVWKELQSIPFGKTISYLELSKRIGDVKAIRAAASTNGKNKLAIIVPCHRVIGSNNDLVGYAGGMHNKRWLLEHETKIAYGVQTLF